MTQLQVNAFVSVPGSPEEYIVAHCGALVRIFDWNHVGKSDRLVQDIRFIHCPVEEGILDWRSALVRTSISTWNRLHPISCGYVGCAKFLPQWTS